METRFTELSLHGKAKATSIALFRAFEVAFLTVTQERNLFDWNRKRLYDTLCGIIIC